MIEPIAEAMPDASIRWHARADSIPQVLETLSQIWRTAGDHAREAHLTDHQHALAQGDPRLAGIMDAGGREARVRTRTSVLTLVVVAARPETAVRALATIHALAALHPSRAIVLTPGDPDGPASLDAQITAVCRLTGPGGSETCTEELVLKTGGELSVHLATVVAPLLIHDLPVTLWWPDDPPLRSPVFLDLVEACDRLLIDSGSFRGDGRERLAQLTQLTSSHGPAVLDIGWMRLTLWRELLAEVFDHPLLTPEVRNIRRVRIDVAGTASTIKIAKAACLAGWLASRLGWEVAQPLEMGPTDHRLTGAFRTGRRQIPVEIRATRQTTDTLLQNTGSLVRVDLEISRARVETIVRVSRQEDHLLATADWNGARVCQRAGRLEPFEEAPYVAEALDRQATDRHFELALGRALRLIGRPADD